MKKWQINSMRTVQKEKNKQNFEIRENRKAKKYLHMKKKEKENLYV